MVGISTSTLISMAVFAIVALVTFLLMFMQKKKAKMGKQTKFGHIVEDLFLGIGVLATWLLTLRLLALIEGKTPEEGVATIHLPAQVSFYGLNIDTIALIVSGVVLIMAIFFLITRVVFIPWLQSKSATEQNLVVMIAQVFYRSGDKRRKKREEKLKARSEVLSQERKKSDPFTKSKIFKFLVVAVIWFLVGRLLELLLGKHESEGITVEIFPTRVQMWGLDLSTTTVTMWVIIGVLILLSLVVRYVFVPRFKEIPKGTQNVLELMIDSVKKYTDERAPHMSDNLAAYILTVAVLLVGCSMVELMGVRSPSADIMMTFALSLCTFFLINYYGIKGKKLIGHILNFAKPTPVVFPIRVLTELAIPLSMACRLFGNMLAGMVIMELLYISLGSHAIGIASIIGLFFNVFHPLLQAFIFVTLSLTFINEAVE